MCKRRGGYGRIFAAELVNLLIIFKCSRYDTQDFSEEWIREV